MMIYTGLQDIFESIMMITVLVFGGENASEMVDELVKIIRVDTIS
jgi:hypothetical protein